MLFGPKSMQELVKQRELTSFQPQIRLEESLYRSSDMIKVSPNLRIMPQALEDLRMKPLSDIIGR